MASYSTNQFKSGLKILIDGDPCSIIENEFVKPGKGQAFNRVKIRNLKNGRVLEKTFKSGESVPAADVQEVDMQYLYSDDHYLHLMNQSNYEQVTVPINTVQDELQWIKEEDVCLVTIWDGQAISIEPPNFVNLRVVKTDPGVKGDTVSGGNKPATLETGAEVRVPLFIETGDVLKIDTRSGSYVSRVKE